MQCTGISVVKNEADIIELFIRHNLKYLNKLHIVEHNCQDNTPDIIKSLKDEGYNLEIYTNSSSRHIQAEEFNRLMREVDSDFITFLDADEFLVSKDFQSSLEQLPSDIVSFLVWHNYVPQPTDDKGEVNVLKRIGYRYLPDTNQHKAMIPRSIYSKPNSLTKIGGHEIYYKNGDEVVPAPYQLISSIHLAHFPCRSLNQIKVKAFANWLATLADPLQSGGKIKDGKIPTWYHWKLLFELFKTSPDITEEEAVAATLDLYMRHSTNKRHLIYDPLPYEEIRYPIQELKPLQCLANTAEQEVATLQKLNELMFNLLGKIKEIDVSLFNSAK